MKKILIGVVALVVGLGATGLALYLTNTAPAVRPLSVAEASSGKPFVVKLHAQWCPKCRMAKGAWSQVEAEYGTRVNMLVLDFTNEANTAASRAEATRLGLQSLFDEYAGATGFVVVLDRRKGVTAEVGGTDVAAYRAAIDAVLASPAAPGE
jgi:thiol-disulfide isomerase/thioredoxin